jgi:protein disulfide-isomerase
MRPRILAPALILALVGGAAAEEAAKSGGSNAGSAAAPAGAAGEWTHDYRAAIASARSTGRPVLIDFTGSDWCPWCMKLQKEVFDTPDFKSWASKRAILMVADIPRSKQLPAAEQAQNEMLVNVYGIGSYPTVVIVDATGKELARTGYLEGGPQSWIQDIIGKARFPK